jgi:hypothetical protein
VDHRWTERAAQPCPLPEQRAGGRIRLDGIQRSKREQPDNHIQDREAEKLADLESLADALAVFRQLHRELDQWERVHLALGLAAVVSGCYGIGTLEAALALTPEIERSPSVKLPSDPIYEQFDLALFERALSEAWAEPARRFPHFGRIETL